ncbi:MAG: ABC transporter permease [Bacteroidaceae bacterium]|nr:ABC transporter permease [Bacteroidaceae bacterium]MBR3906987.1 ABC transporter permease [Bacteroidaceae bacterium]
MKSKIGIIIGREFNERVRKKSFIITTLLTPLLMLGLLVAPMLLSTYSGDEQKKIAVVDDSNIIGAHLQSTDEINFIETELPIEIARKEHLEEFAILHIGKDIMSNPSDIRLYTNSTASITMEMNIATQVKMVIENIKLQQQDIENLPAIIASIQTEVNMQSFANDTSEDSGDKANSSIVATVIAYLLSFILYMFILLYGSMVMQSVIEEKNSRVLEVMVSSVRPMEMMMGKILGVASVALLQIAIWLVIILGAGYFIIPELIPDEVAMAVAMLQQGASPETLNTDTDMSLLQAIATLTDVGYLAKIVVSLVVFMTGGFLLYAALFAAVGSAVDTPQDAQQLQTPITIPIILSLFVMLSVINDPGSDLAFWFSMIPLTSPIVMMARIPYDIPTWEILVSLGILVATFIATAWAAGKIYRTGILMHGSKPSFKELWKWLRFK